MDGSLLRNVSVPTLVTDLMSQSVAFRAIQDAVQIWVRENAKFPCLTKVMHGDIMVSYVQIEGLKFAHVHIPVPAHYKPFLPEVE